MSRLRLGRLPMILMYHSVADVGQDPSHLSVAPSLFAEQMTTLRRLGLRGVSICSLLDAMRARRARRLVGITFDDGYRNVLDAAVPTLKRHGFTATVFVITGRFGGTNEWAKGPSMPLLSANEVSELADAGMEIGSHSMTHTRLARPVDQPAQGRGQREPRTSWRTRGRAGARLRLPVWLHGRGGKARG